MQLSKKYSILFLLLCLVSSWAGAQGKLFYEIIKEDSAVLYFSKDFSFTTKECYDYTRHTRINEKGDFNGYFEDRNIEGLLLGKGTYVNGVKHGDFEFYYQSGILYCAGSYQHNKPVGKWSYFYESGIPERIVHITDSAVLLLHHLEYDAKVNVKDGSGKFAGIVDGEMPTYVTGKVVNGKADGKWIIPSLNGSSLYTERFENGKLLKSSTVSKRKMKRSPVAPKLNKFFVGNYLALLEKFKYQPCDESQFYKVQTNTRDSKLFTFNVRQRINNLIRTDTRLRRNEYYKIGDNYMTIQFSVDEKGKPYDYKLVSEWGEYFFEGVKKSINRAVFKTNNKTMYFHLKFSYSGGPNYKYSFKFTKRDPRSKRKKS